MFLHMCNIHLGINLLTFSARALHSNPMLMASQSSMRKAEIPIAKMQNTGCGWRRRLGHCLIAHFMGSERVSEGVLLGNGTDSAMS